jgi:hypothetical protein
MFYKAKTIYKKNFVRRSNLKLKGKLKQIMHSVTFVWPLNYVFIETFAGEGSQTDFFSQSHSLC